MVSGNDFAGAVLHGRSVVVVACAGSGSSHHLDGTVIAYEAGGPGPSLVLVHGVVGPAARVRRGAPTARAPGHGIRARPSRPRRQRGRPRYAPRCEYEDVAAVVGAVPGPVDLIGHSFGALCALEAARSAAKVRRLVLYEGVPRDGRTISPDGLAERVDALVRARRPRRRSTSSLPGSSTTGLAQLARDHRAASWSASVAAWRCSTASSGSRTVPVRARAPRRHDRADAHAGRRRERPSVRADAEAVAAGLPDAR